MKEFFSTRHLPGVVFNRQPQDLDIDPNKRPWKARYHGKYFDEDGQPRGGGAVQAQTVNLVRYEPAPVPHEQVCRTLGVTDDGTRTPYNELHPAVTPVPFKRVIRKNIFGQIISVKDTRTSD